MDAVKVPLVDCSLRRIRAETRSRSSRSKASPRKCFCHPRDLSPWPRTDWTCESTPPSVSHPLHLPLQDALWRRISPRSRPHAGRKDWSECDVLGCSSPLPLLLSLPHGSVLHCLGDVGRCVIVLISDGRANVPLDVSLGIEPAEGEVKDKSGQ